MNQITTTERRLLVEGQDSKAKPLFKTTEEYEKFRRLYHDRAKPILDAQAIARARSEQRAHHYFVISYNN